MPETFPDHPCRLKKALYYPKQAPRSGFVKIHTFLCGCLCFQSWPYDPYFYVKKEKNSVGLISFYISDFSIVKFIFQKASKVKHEFSDGFKIQECHEPKACFGPETIPTSSKETIKVFLTSYVWRLLSRFNMISSNSAGPSMNRKIDTEVMICEKCPES